MAKYMVIESIPKGCLDKVYERFHQQGRMLPPGLHYIDSWLAKSGSQCYQLMETSNKQLFLQWIKNWDDLVKFDIVELGAKPAGNTFHPGMDH